MNFDDPHDERRTRGGKVAIANRDESVRAKLYEPCPGCDGSMPIGNYVCNTCLRPGSTHRIDKKTYIREHLVAKIPEISKAKRGWGGCETCSKTALCRARVMVDLCAWVLCEIVDTFDLQHASTEAVEDYELWLNSKPSRRRRKPNT